MRVAVGGEGEGVQLGYGSCKHVSCDSFRTHFHYGEIQVIIACEICRTYSNIFQFQSDLFKNRSDFF